MSSEWWYHSHPKYKSQIADSPVGAGHEYWKTNSLIKCISVKCDASTWAAPSKQALSRFQFKTQVKKPVSTVAEVSNCASICHSQDPHVESFKQIHESIQKNRLLFSLLFNHQGTMLVSLVYCFQTEIRHQLSDGLLFCTDIHEAQRMKP